MVSVTLSLFEILNFIFFTIDCTPTKIWMLVRHGTRNPSVKLIKKMRERLPQIRDLILNNTNDFNGYFENLLKKWEIYITDKDQKLLTHEGEEEMLYLAKRMQRRFPHVLETKYSNSSYKVLLFVTKIVSIDIFFFFFLLV